MDAQLRHQLIPKAEVLAVFLAALIQVAGEHAEIGIAQQEDDQRVEHLAQAVGKDASQQKQDDIRDQNKEIQLVVAVAPGHDPREFFSHGITSEKAFYQYLILPRRPDKTSRIC